MQSYDGGHHFGSGQVDKRFPEIDLKWEANEAELEDKTFMTANITLSEISVISTHFSFVRREWRQKESVGHMQDEKDK